MTAPMSVETRQRMIAAAERALTWRRERIMYGRLAVMCMAEAWGWPVDWHSLFNCDRHRHHPLNVQWVGPFDLEAAIVEPPTAASSTDVGTG